MNALVYDGALRFVRDYPVPRRPAGEALVRVLAAGICTTDLEIVKGYMGFRGVLGHEFVGVVEDSDDPALAGRRVVGDINSGCGTCSWCAAGLERHCPHRSVLGILDRDGAFAEMLLLPKRNLHPIPDSVGDEEAVFVEPLAASVEILEQVPVPPTHRVAVLGDGKLGLLIGQVLHRVGCDLVVFGRHPEKLAVLAQRGIRVRLSEEGREPAQFDVVVDATGSAEGLEEACRLVRPRGTVVLKSTVAGGRTMNLSPLVIHEITVVGSRCGPFEPAIRWLERRDVDVQPLISATFPLEEGIAAFEHAAKKGVLKVVLRMTYILPERSVP